eukprot:752172-Hanusia_phi.AAC.2
MRAMTRRTFRMRVMLEGRRKDRNILEITPVLGISLSSMEIALKVLRIFRSLTGFSILISLND